MEQGGALIQLQADDALVREVGDVKPVRGVIIPTIVLTQGFLFFLTTASACGFS